MDAVSAYKKRREHRIKAQRGREDDQWITMKGTHVLIDDGGQAKGGPDRLKTMVNSGGGYKSRDERKYGSNLMHEPEREANKEYSYGPSEEKKSETYESFPPGFRVGGKKYASADDVKKVRATVSRFMNEAKAGDIYEVGGGFGSTGGSRFQVTERGGGKLYIGWIDSDGRRKGNPVQMSRSNVEKYISNGAKKVK